uniref:FAR1 domain-containing protein n=1 Tax=Angiostrongylus cantonensis TaxID=6313 RepID=A0A0K0DLU0_ANGCA
MTSYDVIGLAETRRRHSFNAVYDTREELILGTCDSRRVGVNRSLSMNIDLFLKVIIVDFNAKIGPRRTSEKRHNGTQGLEWNEECERLSEFIKANKTIHGNSQFQKPHSQRWTLESPNGEYHNEIDHIIVNRKFCLTGFAVVRKFYTRSDNAVLRARFYFSRKGEKAAKFKNRSPRTTTNADLFISLLGCWEDAVVDNIDEE